MTIIETRKLRQLKSNAPLIEGTVNKYLRIKTVRLSARVNYGRGMRRRVFAGKKRILFIRYLSDFQNSSELSSKFSSSFEGYRFFRRIYNLYRNARIMYLLYFCFRTDGKRLPFNRGVSQPVRYLRYHICNRYDNTYTVPRITREFAYSNYRRTYLRARYAYIRSLNNSEIGSFRVIGKNRRHL